MWYLLIIFIYLKTEYNWSPIIAYTTLKIILLLYIYIFFIISHITLNNKIKNMINVILYK